MAPIVRGRKGEFREELEALDQQGFRVRIDGEITEITDGLRLEKRKNHTIEAIVDRIMLKAPSDAVPANANPALSTQGGEATPPRYDTRRLETSIIKALQMASGLVLIGVQEPSTRQQIETLYSSTMACPDCGINVPKLEPRSFSFNSTYGACPECHGSGRIYDFDPAKTITDWSKPLLDGAMGPGSSSSYLLRLIKLAAEKHKINIKRPFAELTKAEQDLFLHGPGRIRCGTNRLPRHLRLSPLQSRRDQIRGVPRVHDAVHVCDLLPPLQRSSSAPGVARRHHPHRRNRRSERKPGGPEHRRLHSSPA